MRIGIIAEEKSDVDILYELTCKLIKEPTFSFKIFVGHGCGKLRRKCKAWASNLLRGGCCHLIVLHDLDDNDENELRSKLDDCVRNIGFQGYIILIPEREIEAWLLTDAKALQEVFNMSKMPKLPRRPELVINPKGKLRDIVWKATKKYYVNTIHNRKIAAATRISSLNSCSSFRPYPDFITSIFPDEN